MDCRRWSNSNNVFIQLVKMKNTITNIVGVIVFGLAVYMFTFQGLDTIKFFVLSVVSGVLVYFDNKGIKRIVNKGVKKYLK